MSEAPPMIVVETDPDDWEHAHGLMYLLGPMLIVECDGERTMLTLEAFEVRGARQKAVRRDDDVKMILRAVGGDDKPRDTLTIGGREYLLVATPTSRMEEDDAAD